MKKDSLHKSVVIDLKRLNNPMLIDTLNRLYATLSHSLTEDILHNQAIQPQGFSDETLSHAKQAHFKKQLGNLMGKKHFGWRLVQNERAFRLLAEYVRQQFKSLAYRMKLGEILAQFDFDVEDKAKLAEIREKLNAQNLYPTTVELRNLCRSRKVAKKEDWLEKGLKLPLDFSTQDVQTIRQADILIPHFALFNFNPERKTWFSVDFTPFLPTYFKQTVETLTEQGLLVKYAKPKFFKNEKGDWQAALAIEFKAENALVQKHLMAGVDIGKVKPFSASVVDLKTQTVCSSDIKARKEALRVKEKLVRTTNQLTKLYRKLDHYQTLLNKPCEVKQKNPAFFERIEEKQGVLKEEKKWLRQKNKRLKKHLAYLCARDLRNKLLHLGVGCVNMEKLNWVENQGGKWDFSQMQLIMENKLREKGIDVGKVHAAFSSTQNPFHLKPQFGLERQRQVVFTTNKGEYRIDRDELAAINLALRTPKGKKQQAVLTFPATLHNKKIKSLTYEKHRIINQQQ